MTSVVIFRFTEANMDSIVAMADTRYMVQNVEGKALRTSIEAGSKLFSIPLRVSKGHGFVSDKVASYFINKTFGLAFAGNTTIGLNIAGALSQICAFLECHQATCKLGLADIAAFASKLLTDWHRTYNKMGPWTHSCEVAIFGECPTGLDLQAYHLKPSNKSTGLQIEVSKFNFLDPIDQSLSGNLHNPECHPWLILGDRRQDIEALIKARVADVLGVGRFPPGAKSKAQRSPQYVLEAIVSLDCFETIGNGVQILFSDKFGARPQRWIRPQNQDVPNDEYEWFSYLNYDVGDLGKIGDAEIGDPGGFSMEYIPPRDQELHISEFTATLDRILNQYRFAIF